MPWLSWNTFLPVYNNINVCATDNKADKSEQDRRKRNFIRLNQAHLFDSPSDGVVAPHQNLLKFLSAITTYAGMSANWWGLSTIHQLASQRKQLQQVQQLAVFITYLLPLPPLLLIK